MGCGISSSSAGVVGSKLRMGVDDNTLGPPQRLNLEGKIVLLGDSGVGKSSLALRFCRGRFPEYHEVTIGAAFLQQIVRIDSTGNQVKLYIWDTGGQERFRAMAPLYYRDAAGAVIVYDATSPSSLDAVRFWVKELQNRGPELCCITVAANKCDLMGAESEDGQPTFADEEQTIRDGDPQAVDRAVAEVKAFCEENGLFFIQCSAKSGANVGKLFEELARRIFFQLKQTTSVIDL